MMTVVAKVLCFGSPSPGSIMSVTIREAFAFLLTVRTAPKRTRDGDQHSPSEPEARRQQPTARTIHKHEGEDARHREDQRHQVAENFEESLRVEGHAEIGAPVSSGVHGPLPDHVESRGSRAWSHAGRNPIPAGQVTGNGDARPLRRTPRRDAPLRFRRSTRRTLLVDPSPPPPPSHGPTSVTVVAAVTQPAEILAALVPQGPRARLASTTDAPSPGRDPFLSHGSA
jgi:hypothetical protein